jgi:hypothetical protein
MYKYYVSKQKLLVWYLRPVIPASQDIEIESITVQGQLKQKVSKTSLKNKSGMVVHI